MEADNHKDVFKMSKGEFVLSDVGATAGGPQRERDADAELGERPAAAAGADTDLQHQHGPV